MFVLSFIGCRHITTIKHQSIGSRLLGSDVLIWVLSVFSVGIGIASARSVGSVSVGTWVVGSVRSVGRVSLGAWVVGSVSVGSISVDTLVGGRVVLIW